MREALRTPCGKVVLGALYYPCDTGPDSVLSMLIIMIDYLL